ncbi:MAG: TVP38/TMEM64 family protein [Clostridiales bacterium]|nr:TVP38/TMEM64 family protein [Clostridiales bacterium]
MKKLDRTNKIRLIAIIIFLVVSVAITILSIPLLTNLRTEEGRLLVKQKVEESGAFAPLVYMFIHMLQVVISFIPGGPIEILGGLLFGTFWGIIFTHLGILSGSIIVYYLVKSFGKPLVYSFVSEEKMNKHKLLNDNKRLEMLTFILFLLPGTPKDALTYVVPLTKINPMKYFVLSTIARAPSIATSVFIGTSIGKGNIMISVIIFVVTGVLGIFGILYNNKMNSK